MNPSKKNVAAVLVALVLAGGGAFALRSTGSSVKAGSAPEASEAPLAKNGGAIEGKAARAARDLRLGRSFTYDVKAARTVGSGDKVAMATKIGGRLVLTVVGEAEGGAAVRAELLTPSREDQPAVAGSMNGLSTPFFFVVRADGAIGSFGFPKTMPGDARRQLRSIVSALQVVTGEKDAWQTRESDGAGELVASYTRRGDHLEKTKLSYERLRTPNGLVTPGSMGGTYEVRGGAQIDVDASGWPTSLVEDVAITATFQQVKMAMVEKTEARLVAQGEAKELAGSYEAAKGSFDGDEDALAEGAALAQKNADENLVGGASFRTLLADLEAAKDGRGRSKTAARLGALFRTKPEAVEEARSILLAKGTKESTAKSLAAALGNGGTKEAQKALSDALRSNDTTPGTKTESAVSLGLVEKPTAEARKALTEAMKSPSSDVSDSATLALGNLAKAASESGDPDALGKGEQEDAVSLLLAKLAAAQTPGEKALALDALGNSGDARALDAILAHVGSGDTIVRAAAVGALRFIMDEKAAQVLALATRDPDASVQMAALNGIGTRPVVPFLGALRQVLAEDDDVQVRLTAVRVLARAVNVVTEVESILAEVAAKDADAKVREAATQALSKPKAPVER